MTHATALSYPFRLLQAPAAVHALPGRRDVAGARAAVPAEALG